MPAPSTPSSKSAQAQSAWIQGQQLSRQGRWPDAARRFERAMRLAPRDALYAINLADAELKAGRPEQAAAAAAAARRIEPGNALALVLQCNALRVMHRHEALAELLGGVPDAQLTPELRAMLAQAQLHGGDPKAAVASCMAALVRRPADAGLHLNLGQAFKGLGLKREAAQCFRTALQLGLGRRQVAVQDLLAFYEREVCDWQGGPTQVQALRESIARLPEDAAVETNPFALVTLLDDPLEQRRGVAACARHIASLVRPLPPRQPEPRPRLRVGYVSADFHGHATGYLMAELFERHDRGRFEVFLYSHGPDDGSATRARLRQGAEHWIEAREMGTRALAERIRADGIDILVDLKGYTFDARPMVFAQRPAPVQVAYLGFPGTSGAPWIDYLVGDPFVTPLAHAAHYSEKLAQLPGCYQANDGTRPLPRPPSRASQGLPEDALVLCGFNQPYKISPEVFDSWCRLLQRLPGAVLWLLAWSPQVPEALRREARARGIDPARLVFAPTVGQAEHLDRIACADLFLDTWPCNGHTTASDMLWAGVPVLTFSGRSFASRVAGSLLHALGLPELVCDDVAAYEALAFDLARDAARRDAIAARLDAARRDAPLFSSARLAPQLEALYERMWARALAGLPPAHLPAQADTAA
jgi:predicted O-linked N-acetylglucosamine transferase (SPINDLY family)